MSKPTQITISGVVRTDQYGGAHGDIYLYWRDSRDAASARRGGHTNYGYPGYFLASVHDGTDWRKLQFNRLVEYEQRSYELASQRQNVISHLSGVVASWRGVVAVYNPESRSFTIPGREIA